MELASLLKGEEAVNCVVSQLLMLYAGTQDGTECSGTAQVNY